ncbi:ATPase [Geofilum rubicundum JCM 15548]|uniref:ATPase n=1 Tax=Geofilum rubicundum JCM 15548 TaxID=1236989 RepID=A0A0E9M0G9_9BACT|nr:ATPase [Geofilum rubicundum JCM 15548]
MAKKGERLIYLQCTYVLVDEQAIRREYTPLEAIPDNYEKMVISLDDVSFPSNNGIRHIQAWKLLDVL